MTTPDLVPGIEAPDTPASGAAYEVATTYCRAAIVNHCLRSYVWGAS